MPDITFNPETVYYHGSNEQFNQFEISTEGFCGAGIYFTNCMQAALEYGDKVYAASLLIKNPLVVKADYDNEVSKLLDIDNPLLADIHTLVGVEPYLLNLSIRKKTNFDVNFTLYLSSLGYDGVLIDWGGGVQDVMVFVNEQIALLTDKTIAA